MLNIIHGGKVPFWQTVYCLKASYQVHMMFLILQDLLCMHTDCHYKTSDVDTVHLYHMLFALVYPLKTDKIAFNFVSLTFTPIQHIAFKERDRTLKIFVQVPGLSLNFVSYRQSECFRCHCSVDKSILFICVIRDERQGQERE